VTSWHHTPAEGVDPSARWKSQTERGGVVERSRQDLARAIAAILECREQVRTGETALWLNAAYARRLGASVAQIATAAGVSTDTARKELRRVEGHAENR
jgi:hypothetical protein